jgi:hypothetical protein
VSTGDLKHTRRRLSVISDNHLVEGLDNVNLNSGEEKLPEVCEACEHRIVITTRVDMHICIRTPFDGMTDTYFFMLTTCR